MDCPKCGSPRTFKNGSNRVVCKDCKESSNADGPQPGVPAGHKLKGVSTLYGEDGAVKGQWVKTEADARRQREIAEEAIKTLASSIKGLAKPIKLARHDFADKESAYIIGDAHFGAYAWGAEAGEDFDTDIADRDLRAAIDNLIASAPPSETGLLVDVGDFLHADNRSNMTPAHGNQLDVDTRYQRVIRVAVDALRYCIGRMLQKHKRVEVFIVPGNHNPDSAGWLSLALALYYENEPRVRVERSPAKFLYHTFGDVLIGLVHGDKVKLDQLPSIMAADRAREWGMARHRYWWTGHIHHTKHQEYRGCFVESFNTLAARDAWHAENGYRAERQMQRIDLDPQHGIYARQICNIGMLR